MSARKAAALLFLGLFGTYLIFTPGTVGGRGYVWEEMESGLQMLAVFNAWVKGRVIPEMIWSRHGLVTVLVDLPFIKLGKYLVSPDFILSFQPVLLTAGLSALLYLWLRKLCSPGMSLVLTLSGAFGSMLWPYAYIGLETKQSFLLLLAGYLALARGKMRGWGSLVFFAVVCGFALTVKATGIVLWPAMAYLLYVQFKDDWRKRGGQLAMVVGLAAAVWLLGAWSRNFFWGPVGGGYAAMRPWMIDSSLQYFTNAIGMFGSPTKGLFIFAPSLLVGIFAIPQAFKRNRHIAIFAVLLIGCTVGFMSLLKFQFDEVWGSRYFHLIVAPVLLAIGAAWPRFAWRRDFLLVALSIVGFVISFLGSFYYYGGRNSPTWDTRQNTMEWLTGDMVWNEVTFSARLFSVWLEDSKEPVLWTAHHVWVWEPPPGAMTWEAVDLRKYATPQSFLIQNWRAKGLQNRELGIFWAYTILVVAGLFCLIRTVVGTIKESRKGISTAPAELAGQTRHA